MSAENEAIAALGGFGLESVLEGLGDDAVSSLRSQLGYRTDIGYGKDDLYSGKFADDDDDDDGPRRRGDPFGKRTSGKGTGKDWEDEADQEVRREMELERQGLVKGGMPTGRVRGEVDDYDDDEEEEEEEEQQGWAVKAEPVEVEMDGWYDERPSPEPEEPVDIRDLFPTFEPNAVLQFTDLFASLPRKRRKLTGNYVSVNYPPAVSRLPSTATYLKGLRPMPPRGSAQKRPEKLPKMLEQAHAQLREQEAALEGGNGQRDGFHPVDVELARLEAESGGKLRMPADERAWATLAMGDWEDEILWDDDAADRRGQRKGRDPMGREIPTMTKLARPRNPAVENNDWENSIIWDARKPWRDFTGLALTEDDPEMLLQLRAPEDDQDADDVAARARVRAQQADPFNLSNDRVYEATTQHRRRIRQTFGALEVQHAYPARKLQLPLYKTRLTKSEARSWHRPALQFPVNSAITFTKVRPAKKKKDRLGRKIRNPAEAADQLLKGTQDLSLKDNTPFVLMEFSEEAPPIVSNIGMGNIMVNYYRKMDAKDATVPQEGLGEPFILDVNDESPFMKFGSIQPGQTIPTLYNNLVRAPLFRHRAEHTDFLVIKSTVEGGVNYYIRRIENLYAIGQTYPIVEVPGPKSRKLTTQMRNRLQWIAYRLCERAPKNRIKISRLTRYFSDQTELQMRQRLKEFMEYNRKGTNQGFWAMKLTVKMPDKEEFFKLVTPESICLSESMAVGQRHLLDAGYGKEADEEDDEGGESSKLDTEQQLAPWSTTKNFMHANSNKAMLQLHGEGDPSGRGEAFSFIRVSMKEIFLREGETIEERNAEIAQRPKSTHRYNVNEQQEIYRQEIERIWQAQLRSLSNPVPPELTVEDELRARGKMRAFSTNPETPWSAGAPTPGDWSRRGSRSPSSFSRPSSPEKDDGASTRGGVGANKVVRIRRLIDGKWQKEIVRDPAVVNAYLRQRRLIEEQEPLTGDLAPTDDPEVNARRKKAIEAQIAKLQKNQERRLARKNAKDADGNPIKKGAKPDTTRRCGNCGQIGHMKTNRKCPRWAEFNLPGGIGSAAGIGMDASPLPQVGTPQPES